MNTNDDRREYVGYVEWQGTCRCGQWTFVVTSEDDHPAIFHARPLCRAYELINDPTLWLRYQRTGVLPD